MQHATRAPALLLLAALFASGCASAGAERRAEQATFRSNMHEQRAARLEAENAHLRATAAVQQILLVQSLVAKARTAAPNVAAAPALEDAPKPLVDTAGQTIPVLADEPAVRDIVARMEAMLGRPLRPQERLMVGQLLRRPRSIDASDPWVMQ